MESTAIGRPPKTYRQGLVMGEAKKRGSVRDRKAFAMAEGRSKLEKMAEKVNLPVDEDLFLYCSNLYSAAASFAMPVENPEEKKFTSKILEPLVSRICR